MMGVFRIGGTTVPCSPCFSYFAFVDYGDGTLILTNGPRTINITSVSQGTVNTPNPISPGAKINITGVSAGDITITYIDTSSGIQHTDSATLH
ncbi:MAG: hypothetical protein J7L39_00195 [Candidatus Aenigmarchaeota archaeon]|nr:hypothetical protein [Candidatus Aenigmarchaeota archaeon]